jgi:hypothetical protein
VAPDTNSIDFSAVLQQQLDGSVVASYSSVIEGAKTVAVLLIHSHTCYTMHEDEGYQGRASNKPTILQQVLDDWQLVIACS